MPKNSPRFLILPAARVKISRTVLEEINMSTALMIILGVVSVLLVIVILMQPSQSDGLSSSIGGGAEQLFGKKRAQGYEVILKRATVVLFIAFIVLSLIILVLAK